MTKLELNNKLSELYGIVGTRKRIFRIDYIEENIYVYDLLIDDWIRLMDLAVDNELFIQIYSDFIDVYAFTTDSIKAKQNEKYINHESPQAATRFAIAMALVKLAEDK